MDTKLYRKDKELVVVFVRKSERERMPKRKMVCLCLRGREKIERVGGKKRRRKRGKEKKR